MSANMHNTTATWTLYHTKGEEYNEKLFIKELLQEEKKIRHL
jgi:hypothetical protein